MPGRRKPPGPERGHSCPPRGRGRMSGQECPRSVALRVLRCVYGCGSIRRRLRPSLDQQAGCAACGARYKTRQSDIVFHAHTLCDAPRNAKKKDYGAPLPAPTDGHPGQPRGEARRPERRHVAGLRRRSALSRQHAGAPPQEHSGTNFRLRKQAVRCRIRRDKMSSCEKITRTVV
jgi:hypothetical protein